MATAIEYGLVLTLIAATTIGVVQCSTKKEAVPEVKKFSDILHPLRPNDDTMESFFYVDQQTGCQYILTYNGITIRYRANGQLACPQVSSPGVKPQGM